MGDFELHMTENELKSIASSANINEAFYNYWTQKESVIKAHGHGLSIPLQSFEISNYTTRINEETYYLKEIKIDEKYKCHVSLKTDCNEISIKKIKNM